MVITCCKYIEIYNKSDLTEFYSPYADTVVNLDEFNVLIILFEQEFILPNWRNSKYIAIKMEDKQMKSELLPAVQAVAEFMPPKKNGIFEKSMEVAKLLLEHEPASIIAHTVDGAIQNYGMMKEMKYRVEAIKYVTHLEEVRINAQVEIAKMQIPNKAMMMYIDRKFQQELDHMQNIYLKQSSIIEQSGRRMIQEVNNQVRSHLSNIDKRYIETVQENESKCAMYRDFLNKSEKDGVTQYDVIFFMTKKLVDNMDRYNSKAVASVCDVLKEMICQNPNISFDEYLSIRKNLKRL